MPKCALHDVWPNQCCCTCRYRLKLVSHCWHRGSPLVKREMAKHNAGFVCIYFAIVEDGPAMMCYEHSCGDACYHEGSPSQIEPRLSDPHLVNNMAPTKEDDDE